MRGSYRDVFSSLVVFLVALPLCMGIALASGAPPAAGLVAGIVGGIVTGALSGAPLQVTGPAAGLTVLVWEIVREHGLPALGAIVVLAGLLQIAAGLLKLGQMFRAVSPAVIYGMLAGIGVLIFASQFHLLFANKPEASGIANLLAIPLAVHAAVAERDATALLSALVGFTTLVVLIVWQRFRPKRLALLPGALLGVVAGAAIAAVFRLPVEFVSIPENLLSGTVRPSTDSFLALFSPALLVAAFTAAFVASAESLLSASAVDRMQTGTRADYDRELAAQGVGNLVAGLVGGLPMTGVIVRSAANVQAGARTRLSTILHGFWLLLLVVAAPGVLNTMPTASLAAILVYTGLKLVSLERIRELAALSKAEAAIYAATVVGIVAVDLLTGVLLGLALTAARLLHRLSHISIHIEHWPERNLVEIHLEGAATFLRLPKLAKALESVPAGSHVEIHFEHLDHVDHACLDLIANWERRSAASGTTLWIEWDDLTSRYHRTPPRLRTAPVRESLGD